MEIMISEDFENELSVTYDGAGYRVESCDVESIGGELREITVILRKVEEVDGEGQPANAPMPNCAKFTYEGYDYCDYDKPNEKRDVRATYGQDQQATVDHTARQDCGTSPPQPPYRPGEPYPASLRGNW